MVAFIIEMYRRGSDLMGVLFKQSDLDGYIEWDETKQKVKSLKVKEFDKRIKGTAEDRSTDSDFCIMLENLNKLRTWCETGQSAPDAISKERRLEFLAFFENAIVGAFFRYRKSKKAAWAIGRNWILLISAAILPVLTSICSWGLNLILSVAEDPDSSAKLFLGNGYGILACVIAAALLVFKVYTKWVDDKNDKETWVRHSTCFAHLNIALSGFVLSEKSNDDFELFVKTSHAILTQNLDQFALNLSAHGLAKRPEVK